MEGLETLHRGTLVEGMPTNLALRHNVLAMPLAMPQSGALEPFMKGCSYDIARGNVSFSRVVYVPHSTSLFGIHYNDCIYNEV